MTQNTDQERELFEAFASDNGKWLKAIERDARGDYLLLTTTVGWMWWRAARSAPAVSVPQETCVICGSDKPYTGTCGSNDPRALCKKPAPQPPEAVQLDEIKAAWNAQADEFNQWDELGEDEKVEWAAAYAVTKERAAISKATDDEAFDDFAEDVDDSECHNCSGTGEGMYDSQSCVVCLGKGFL